MRVDGRRRVDGERGATIIFVALLMVVLLLVLAIAVDGGALYLKRRHMVNAADAAALAAAQSCANDKADEAPYWADRLATDNESNAVNTAYSYGKEGCDPRGGTVTVTYSGNQPLVFGGLTGTSSHDVSATAMARWGGAGAVVGVMPFMLSKGRLTACDIPNQEVGTDCYFWFNNKDIGSAQWSQLNLDQWDVGPTANCTSAGASKTEDWISGGGAPLVSLNYPDPTYVCIDTGVSTPVFLSDRGIAGQIGDVRYFPVNDPSGQVDKNGNLAPPPASPDKYDIVGFAILKITGIYKGNTQEAATYCAGPWFQKDSNAYCLGAEWEGYTTAGSGTGGENFGVASVSLAG